MFRTLRLLPATLALALCLACVALAQEPADPLPAREPVLDEHAEDLAALPEGASPLPVVIARNWDRWAQGRAELTKVDAIALMPDASLQGEDAAALAALELHLRKIDAVDRAAALAMDAPKVLNFYAKSVRKLRAVDRRLFPNGGPTFLMMEQGPAGDCYFFSGTGWMARYRPQVIRQAITELPGGRFRVRFPSGDDIEVSTPTDAEMANNNSESTLRDGLWLPVLEKAMGLIMQHKSRKSAAIPDPSVAVNVPGGPAPIVRLWTGNEVDAAHLGGRTERSDLRGLLDRMQRRNSMAGVLLLKKPEARLPYDHVYAVLDYDAATDSVTLWNPWGTDYTPPCPSSPACGYARSRGAFRLSLDEFDRFFTYLAVERN